MKTKAKNHLKAICEHLGVDTLEEAVEIINKSPDKNVTVVELESFQKRLNELYEEILTNINSFNVKPMETNDQEDSE